MTPARVACAAALWAASLPAAVPPGFPSAFVENDGSDRRVLLDTILPDLRVFVDLDSADMPHNALQGPLPASEVLDAAALGIGNWATVLPGMGFRMVSGPDSANLVIRFRTYGPHISGGATAEAFLPGQWRPAPPAPGAFDFACGARVPGRLPGGGHCRETQNNIILFQTRNLAFRAVDTLDAGDHQEFLDGLTDRRDPAKRFFRFLPDERYWKWPDGRGPDRSTCVDGAAREGRLPVFDLVCPSDSAWTALPHARSFSRDMGPYDIAQLVQHEFGHALLGMHTGDGGCLEKTPEDFTDYHRDPVYLARSAIRRAGPRGAFGYSVMFTGNGHDAAWNSRGLFPLDAARLAGAALGGDCRTIRSAWRGYTTSYPRSSRWIVLRNRSGGAKYVDDWDYAIRLMGWPGAGPGPAKADWFQVGLLPKDEDSAGSGSMGTGPAGSGGGSQDAGP